MTSVETIELRPGHKVSRVIKGGWQLAGDHGVVDRNMAVRDMRAFLDAGITTFDCADIYRGVEEMIGEFIADLRRGAGAGVANRVCVHTKLVPDLSRLADIRPDEIEAIVDRSLQRLKIEFLHLVQFFWWDLSIGDPVGSLEVLKRCQDKGKIGNLGINNWDAAEISPFVEAGFDIAAAQVQYSVLDRRASNSLADWAVKVARHHQQAALVSIHCSFSTLHATDAVVSSRSHTGNTVKGFIIYNTPSNEWDFWTGADGPSGDWKRNIGPQADLDGTADT